MVEENPRRIEKWKRYGILKMLYSHIAWQEEGDNEMRGLLVVERSPAQKYLIKIDTKALVKEVRQLIENRKHSKAMTAVFEKGKFEKIVSEDEMPTIDADLILSNKSARWDLTK